MATRFPVTVGNSLKQKQSPTPKFDLGVLGLLLAAILMAIIAYTLKDYLGVPFKLLGSLVWCMVLPGAFFFGLVYFAQFILPTQGTEGWTEGFRTLYSYYLQGPFTQAPRPVQLAMPPANENGELPRPPSLPIKSFEALRAGIIPNYSAVALMRGSSFVRAAGPGFVKLSFRETITDVVDLRKQLRGLEVVANTRDGIPVETRITVIFRVRQSALDYADDVLYPYDRDAIFHVCYANSVNQNRLHGWDEQIAPQAAAILVDELAKYPLNDLYQEDATLAPFDMIKQTIKRRLEHLTDQWGVEILAVSLGHLQLPDKVVDQRIKTWQVAWEQQIQKQRAAGNAEAVRRMKNARARAQIEIIYNITQNIDTMRQSGQINLTEIVMLRTIEALEEATSDPRVQSMLPQQLVSQLVADTSDQIQAWIDEREP
jgi:regulator of protease activity HflC (stomatin/prohibitin superfamily)